MTVQSETAVASNNNHGRVISDILVKHSKLLNASAALQVCSGKSCMLTGTSN